MAAESIEYPDPSSTSLLSRWRAIVTRVMARSERALAITFAMLILIGAILLWLPVSHRTPLSFLDALFTSTSAVCVTGLAVKDTGSDFTGFGQGVIATLMQLGALGIMSFAAVAAQVLGGRLSFRSVATLSDTFYQGQAASLIRRDLKRIIIMMVSIEAFGAAWIYLRLGEYEPGGHSRAWWAIFHAISAFCNAGFSLYSDNMTRYASDVVMLAPIMLLIIFGGLGHATILEMARRFWSFVWRREHRPLRWSLNARIVLWTSAGLILWGWLMLSALKIDEHEPAAHQTLLNGLFQSVSGRTAGFNTVAIGEMPRTALLVLAVLMFIGGSPGSCAGGIKTTTMAIWFAQVWAWLRGHRDVTIGGRRILPEIVARSGIIIGLAMLWCIGGGMLLLWLEEPRKIIALEDLMFEQISAFGTVGLSTGITPALSPASKMWIILSMFVGRIGPLTAALLVSYRREVAMRYPEERVLVG